MSFLILLSLALAPAVFFFYFFWIRDRWEKEPWSLLLMLAFWGGISVIPVGIVELAFFPKGLEFESVSDAVKVAFLCAGLIEEGAKFLFVYFLTLTSVHFREEYDGIIYAVAVGLGFAAVENVFYVISAMLSGEGALSIALMRAFTAVPMHALDGVILGFFIGRARFMKDGMSKFIMNMTGLILAIVFHGLYDMFAFLTIVLPQEMIGWCIVGLVWTMVVQWGTAQKMVAAAQRRSHGQHSWSSTVTAASVAVQTSPVATAEIKTFMRRFCRFCGKPVNPESKFCTNCGSKLR
ncbi:MAG TPA: PrsW family intramembrane metalloprotease [Firmicutes bacterium]|nr:PrsW family intramembrane metalloprotease [Bacillota bacterium]